MSKKDRAIDVTVNDINQQEQEVLIGKKVIGTIESQNQRFVATVVDGDAFKVKSQEEGLEVILQQYHLHQG
ncbi:DUF2969 domain-containing protein [Paucilactobacillus sp. N302-9]